MFNEEFYPTPRDLIDTLLTGIDIDDNTSVLEPSAGKGDIVRYIKERYGKGCRYGETNTLDIDCIEINTDLQNVLIGAGFRVVHNDFLTFYTGKQYDLIVMNPPFSNGDEHLLKAIAMQERYGGQIRCILNAETLKNPYSNKRKILAQKLADLNADIKYISDGFRHAEHKTNVEVSVIKIDIPRKAPECSLIFDEMKKTETERQSKRYENTDIITSDFIKGIVQQYNFEIDLGLKLIDECRYVNSKILKSFDKDEYGNSDSILCLSMNGYTGSYHYTTSVQQNEYIKAVRRKYWKALFKNPEFTGLMTSNILSQFQNKIDTLIDYDFSEFNIYTVKLEILNNTVKGVDDTILNLFEEYSNKYHWFDKCSNNVHYYNGWKTNKAYKVGKKVIVPYSLYISHDYTYENGEWICYQKMSGEVEKLVDTEKVFNYIDGGMTDFDDIKTVLARAAENEQTKNIECKYFQLTFYKKGTCHITFKDDRLLKKFNLFGSQRKGWLPPCYGKATYEEMNDESRAVIDEFEGAESYAETMSDLGYYIQDTKKMLQLEGVSE